MVRRTAEKEVVLILKLPMGVFEFLQKSCEEKLT